MELGWIGTGIMGAPMVRRLLRAGHRVRVFNRSVKKAQALVADGAMLAPNAAEAVRGVEAAFTMVPDTPDLESVADQIEPALTRDQLVIDMSTVAPAAARTIASRFAAHGIAFLDAPVSGGDIGAAEGTLTIMVGGSRDAFERATPLLTLMGKRVTHMGEPGAGQMTKLANQIAVALTLEAAAEALMFAREGGLDPALVLEAIGAGAASSWQLSNLGPRINARDYQPGFYVKLMRKDLRLVSEAVAQSRMTLPGLALVKSLFNAAAGLGHDLDGTQSLAAALDLVAIGADVPR